MVPFCTTVETIILTFSNICFVITNPLVGNSVCNDELNNLNCNFDGGDCCPNPNMVGDGICNDDTNHPECNYDGGDCCGSNVDIGHCTECACHGKKYS